MYVAPCVSFPVFHHMVHLHVYNIMVCH